MKSLKVVNDKCSYDLILICNVSDFSDIAKEFENLIRRLPYSATLSFQSRSKF